MTTTQELAEFVRAVSYGELDDTTREELQKRILDSVGIAGTAHHARRVTRTGGINEWKATLADRRGRGNRELHRAVRGRRDACQDHDIEDLTALLSATPREPA